jgi:predicted anti-sigma-YlaC factor YlaD
VKHLEEAEIALFVEGKFDQIDEGAIACHLRDCDQCRQEYKAAVLMSWFWRRGREAFAPSPEVAEDGMRMTERSRDGDTGRVRLSRRLMSIGKRSVLAPVAAVVLVGAVAVWLAVGMGGSGPVPDPVIQSMYASATMVSNRTEFVLPGTEGDFRPDSPVYRSGLLSDDEALTDALIYLTDKKHSGQASRVDLYWLTAGFVAAGQLDEAVISATDALRQYPSDNDLLTLAAVIECMGGDNVRSELLLRDALSIDPADPVTKLNLAVVLLKNGNGDEAESLLRGLIRDDPDSRLAERARRLLP